MSEIKSANVPVKKNRSLVPLLHFKRLGRELAMQFLFQCDLTGMEDFASKMENFWAQAEYSGHFPEERVFRKGRAYAEKLIAGVCEYEQEIDSVIREYSDKWDLSRMAVVDRNIIRVAVYEMFHCPDIPVLVSINEAIEIAKDYSSVKAGSFINGLLNAVKGKVPPRSKTPPEKKGEA